MLAARELQSAADEAVYNDAVRVTKIFSGIFFAGLAGWLSMANGTKLSFIQQAALEKRLTVCCFLGVYVGAFSAFFNFFQLTEVDDVLLDREGSFTLDFSRPLEWIMTCPLMQLALVLMGGSRIPEYRRMVMPGLSVIVLVCGTASMLLWDVWVYVAYGVGLCFACVMFWLNRQQIVEHSDGQECLLYGDSEFRKASILLIVTWVPFPTFYALSPEGFGIITDILFVQVGWAFLNIVSKFTFIFYIQRIKDNYCNRLKVKREFAGVQTAGPKGGGLVGPDGTITPPLSGMDLVKSKQQEKATSEMGALVVETMNFLGMAQNSDRFLRLLQKSNITSLTALEGLTQHECNKLTLPWDLVAAVQKRLRVWRLEMQDEAELALEQGELHYQMEEPLNKAALADKLQAMAPGVAGGPSPAHQQSPVAYQAMNAPMLPGMIDEPRIARLEDTLMAMQQQTETIQQQNEYFQTEVLRRLSEQQQHLMQPMPSVTTTPNGTAPVQQQLPTQLLQQLQQQLQQYENFQTEVMRRLSEVGADSPKAAPSSLRNTIEMTVAATLKNKEMESLFEHRIEELICAAQVRIEQAADKVSDSLRAQVREVQGAYDRARETEGTFIEKADEKMKAFMVKTEEKLQAHIEKSDENMQAYIGKTDEKMQTFMAKTDEKMQMAVEDVNKSTEYTRRVLSDYLKEARTAQESRNSDRRQEDMERNFARKLEDSNAKILEKQDRVAEFLRGALQNDITTVMSRSDMVVDVVKENGMMVKESLGDLKRLQVNGLEIANATQDTAQQNLHRAGEIRNAVEGISSQLSDAPSRSALTYGDRIGDRSPANSYRGEERERPATAGRRYDGRSTMGRTIS